MSTIVARTRFFFIGIPFLFGSRFVGRVRTVEPAHHGRRNCGALSREHRNRQPGLQPIWASLRAAIGGRARGQCTSEWRSWASRQRVPIASVSSLFSDLLLSGFFPASPGTAGFGVFFTASHLYSPWFLLLATRLGVSAKGVFAETPQAQIPPAKQVKQCLDSEAIASNYPRQRMLNTTPEKSQEPRPSFLSGPGPKCSLRE